MHILGESDRLPEDVRLIIVLLCPQVPAVVLRLVHFLFVLSYLWSESELEAEPGADGVHEQVFLKEARIEILDDVFIIEMG